MLVEAVGIATQNPRVCDSRASMRQQVVVRAIIIESDSPALRLLAWGLREEGVAVDVCPSGAEIAGLAAAAPPADAIIINAMLDDAAKAACVASLRAAVTTWIIDLCVHDGDGCCADGHVQAPWRLADVVAAMDRA